MTLLKPDEIAADPFKSAKWDELTQGRSFAAPDAPTLSILCRWHKMAHAAMSEMDGLGGRPCARTTPGFGTAAF